MTVEVSGKTGEASRVVRVTVGDQSVTMPMGEFSRLLANPLALTRLDVAVIEAQRSAEE